mmetsp:Transcript_11431/g.21602  ORF Transcript_11431/g.21602 Transcript_11431/m.21602 type:complete len:231 (-) Transcript_11431:69-761(-)
MLSCCTEGFWGDAHEANIGVDAPEDKVASQKQVSAEDYVPHFSAEVSPVNPLEFNVVFTKPQGHAGMKLAQVESLLVVEDIGSGHIAQWNSTQTDPSTAIQTMDRIVAVNGYKGTAEELLARFGEEGDAQLTFEHPRYFAVTLKRDRSKESQNKLGLEVSACNGGLGVVVLAVQEEGLIPAYNKNAPEKLQIKANSSIYAINGKEWPSLTLLRMLQKLDDFKITMRTWSE